MRVMGDESPYDKAEFIGGSMAGTAMHARPSVPLPASPAPLSSLVEPASLAPTGSALLPPPPPPEAGLPSPVLSGASPPHRTALDAQLDQMHAVIGLKGLEHPSSSKHDVKGGVRAVAAAAAGAARAQRRARVRAQWPTRARAASGAGRCGWRGGGGGGVADGAVGVAGAEGATGGKRSRSPSPAAHLRPAAELHRELRSDLLKIIRQGMMSTEGCAQSPPPPLAPPVPSVALASVPSSTPAPAPLPSPGGAVGAGGVGVADGKRSRSPSPAAHLRPAAELHRELRSDLLKIIRQGPSNDEPKNVMEIEAKQSGTKVVKLIVLRKVKTQNDDADSTPEKASKLEKKDDDGPDSSGSRSDDSQDGRSHATVISDLKFQRASHLFRRQNTHAEKRPFKCGSCGHDFEHSDDVLKHSRICKREEQIVDITEESAIIKVESKSDASDVSPRSEARSPRPPAPKRGRGRPPKRVPNFMHKKKLGTPEKASKLENTDDEEPDSSGSSSDDSQDGRSHATVISDLKFQRASHLFRRHAGETDTEKHPFKCGSCGCDFARSDDALIHSRICKREERTVDMMEESAVIKVESKSDASDVSPRSEARSPRPPAPKKGRGRPPKRVPNFIREKKKLDKKICKSKRVVLKPRPVFKPQLTLAEQQLQLKRTRGRPPKNYYNRKKDIHKKPSLIMQGTLFNSTSQNMQTVDLQNLEDSSSEVITGSLSPILRSDGDPNRNVNLSPFYGFVNPTKNVFNPLTDVHHTSFDDKNSSQEEPEVIVPHVFMQTQIESEENVPSIGMETTIMSEKEIVKSISNKEEIKDKRDQVQTEANVSTSTTSSVTITSIISLKDNVQQPVEDI
ncbi:unnamed protein product [Parnassius apollo]|uniref:(apollo) hypothetical protein n=1 Tax=Parnassius apollo TaxID=110799 RepID=A0A8S3WZY5_PARAO|nr:unnamed protein product [Parnassius apollo]